MMTKNNPILQEVRDAREALAAKFDFDVHRIYEDAVARQSAKTDGTNLQKSKHNKAQKRLSRNSAKSAK